MSLRIAVTSGSHPTTGILRVTCGSNSGISVLACPGPIQLTGNNPQPSSILCLICIHDVTLGSGHFTVTAENTLGVTISFSGDWLSRMPLSSSSFRLFAKVLLLGTFGSLVVDSQGRYVDSQEKFVFSHAQYC